jgi:hypothetical protein
MADDDHTPPHYQMMDTDREVVCIMLDVSKFQKRFGRGGPPMFHELLLEGPPASLRIDGELWDKFQQCLHEKGAIPLHIMYKTYVLVLALMAPVFYWGGLMDAGDDLPSTVFNVLLVIYLAVLAGIAWIFSNSVNTEILENRKAAVESMAEELQAAGYSIELVHEKWDCCANATYVRCTPTTNIDYEEIDYEEMGV